MPDIANTPAAKAAEEALAEIKSCLDGGKSFRLEAGAGAGKTYSLVQALRYLVAKRGAELIRHHQKVACITYTNVAKEEIETRTDRHAAIEASTIHAFCWSLIKGFQPFLRNELRRIEGWGERLDEAGLSDFGNRHIEYSLGYPKIEDAKVTLGHNDVLVLTVKALQQSKFRSLLSTRYPIIFIDEYQDTDRALAEAIKTQLLESESSPLIGLFGDHWQKIYGHGCGAIDHRRLVVIGKQSNFRSVGPIVECLNRMRPELPQRIADDQTEGSVAIYHSNSWPGQRQSKQPWAGDLPPEAAEACFSAMMTLLTRNGWEFIDGKSKVLMLTHSVLAARQGYQQLLSVFGRTEAVIKKEDEHIKFFADTLEPVCRAYTERRFGDMLETLGPSISSIRTRADKAEWSRSMDELLRLRSTGTIGDVIEHLRRTRRPMLPDPIERSTRELEQLPSDQSLDELPQLRTLRAVRQVPYQEVVAACKFMEESTPFATKHGVKGAEFENVLVVCGRGWNLYNFAQFLEWGSNPPGDKRETFERNRNLFYVACSRPKKRLAVLFTQKLSEKALETLREWFGRDAVQALQV